MANTAIVIARMDPMLMRPERGADMVRSRHCSVVSSAYRIADSSCADIARFDGRRRFETMPAKPMPNATFRQRATALRKYPSYSVPTPVNLMDCRASRADRFQVHHRNSVVLKSAQPTPTMISKAWACLRTSIFIRQSDARTNTRADLMASRRCIFASPAQLVSRLMRA